jgi:nicotine blue oxidoreductase
MPSVAGILLAAGGGSRLGRPKALVEIGGQTLAARGAGLLRAGGADPIIVVTGAAPVDLAEVTLVANPDWRTGMGSSLVAGLTAARDLPPAGPDGTDGCGAVVIALADQPLIGAEAVRRLIAAHAAGATVAVAAYDGRPRNPVLIGRQHWDEVLATTIGDAGARPFLRAHPGLVTVVDCTGTGRPDDIDTPSDLARVTELAGKLPLGLQLVPAEPGGADPHRPSWRRAVQRSRAWCRAVARNGPPEKRDSACSGVGVPPPAGVRFPSKKYSGWMPSPASVTAAWRARMSPGPAAIPASPANGM